jgi:hypothetical protein
MFKVRTELEVNNPNIRVKESIKVEISFFILTCYLIIGRNLISDDQIKKLFLQIYCKDTQTA